MGSRRRIITQLFALGGFGLTIAARSLRPGAAAGLATIRTRGYLRVAVKDNRPPLGFRKPDGQLDGLEIEIAQRLATELFGNTQAIRFQPVSNPDRLTVLLEGAVDLMIAGMAVTPNRTRLVNFTAAYYRDGTVLVTANSQIQDLSDLANRSIAVLENSTAIAQVRYLLPKATLVNVTSYQEGQDCLSRLQAEAFAGDASILAGWVREFPQYRLIPTRLSSEALAIAIPKGVQYDELYRWVDRAIVRWQKEGWLRERATYWGLP